MSSFNNISERYIPAPDDVIKISGEFPIIAHSAAMDIVDAFKKRERIRINIEQSKYGIFINLCGAMWIGGYITGKREERALKKEAAKKNTEITRDAETIACMLEIYSELGYIIENGMNEESEEIINFLYRRFGVLLDGI